MKKILLLFSLMLVSYGGLLAQRTVTGKVVDPSDGSALPGVNILEQGTSNGTVTDIEGNYSLSVGENATLIFSFIGYKNKQVAVGSQSVINIDLEEDVTQLSEVVVIGYGTVKKSDATGAVAVVDEEQFNKGFQTSPEQLIQGRVSGVQVVSNSGEPGAATSIRIRGASSIRADNNPLIVLDGVPLDGRDISAGADVGAGRVSAKNPLNFINPNDIASINILKDASATAIYGSRGANGVVIITTKQGKQGKPELTYSASFSSSSIPENRKYDLLSASEFVSEVPNTNLHFGADVDAFDEITRTAFTQDHNLSYGGTTENGGSYRISLGIQDQEGVIKSTGLEKYSGSVNIGQSVLDERVKLQGSLIASFVGDQGAALADNVGAEGDMLISALRWNPTRPFRDANGDFIQPSDNERNPLAFLNYYDDETETTRIFGNISATINIIEGLDYKVNFGVDRSESERRVAVSRALNANFASGSGGIGNIENIKASTRLVEHTLNFTRDLNDDFNINALLGYSYQKFVRRGSSQRGVSFLDDNQSLYTSNLNFASSFPANQNSSFKDPDDELQSYFGRVNVSMFDKFLLTATLRADGSSRFGENNKYGYFPSAAFAWRLGDEDFAPELFSDLKLRLGWGITGNQEFPSGSAQNQYKPLDDGSGIQQSIVGNPDLVWEETTQYNFGLDFGFFDNRLTGSIDYYQKETKDLIFRLRVPQQGPDVFVWRNLDGVTVNNSGIDFNLDAIAVDKQDLSVDVGFNLSVFNNEIKNVSPIFPDGIITGEINGQGLSNQRAQLLYDGQELYAFYLPVFTGYDENGLSTFEDINGDGENTASGIVGPGNGDRKFVGSPNPDMTLGIRSSVNYKKFDASIYFNGAFGHQVFDNTSLALFSRAALNGGANVDKRVLSSEQGGGDSPVPSTQFLEDADFLRLTNLTLGYTFGSGDIAPWIQSLRLFVTGQNLFVLTGYEGFDPEVNVNKSIDDVPSFGIDYAAYPRARTFTMGLRVQF
ncbi:TonB-dependent receptor [Fulvivirga sp. 29W222]|uniref:TonB-dependent receptor n=1 Tax=Fulvivirga marina TaxID=2494733 RepID=A0A937G615_9BACT|nr:TonB-dependent receptor [Fulvivirga marina]MBL6449081.1 TonB-dependent receptor [Fulvivirga marina]